MNDMNEDFKNLTAFASDTANPMLQPITRSMLPDGCMQEFQDEASRFFQEYANPVVGYVITTPEKRRPIQAHSEAMAVACVVVRSEEDFDKYANSWRHPYVCNVQSLDGTACLTAIAFTGGETPTESERSIIHIPDRFISKVIDESKKTGHIAVVLCSLTRALLLVFPFDDADMDGLQAAAMASANWRPYAVYDEKTMREAAAAYGHLSKGCSEGWGVEIPPFFSEEQAKAMLEEQQG